MFGSKENFVPISEAKTEEIKIYPNLPGWVNTDQIGVNMALIHRLTHLAGIYPLIVTGSNSLETTSLVPEITGVDSQGSASASFKAAKTLVPTHNYRLSEGDDFLTHDRRWSAGLITINNAEITQRIRDDNRFQGDIRSSKAWSYYLNQTIKDGINNLGSNFLVKGLDRGDWMANLTVYGLAVSFICSSAFLMNVEGYLTNMLGGFYVGLKLPTLLSEILNLASNPHQHRERFSLLPGPQIDRSLVLRAYSYLSGPIVKPIS